MQELLKAGGKKLVFTFDSLSMTTKGARGLLMTDYEKREKLLNMGVNEVISRNFAEIKDTPPNKFVKNILGDGLKAKKVICGENFRFGKGGRATANDLKTLCAEYGIETAIVPTVSVGGEAISTTRIRRLIECGQIEEANGLLGYPYGFEGIISHGDRIGTKMGIKTVNIGLDPIRVAPKKGVYASMAAVSGKVFRGVTNVGTRPTVHDDDRTVIETHILDFQGDIYGESLRIELLKFMREEKRFDSLEELRRVVANDIKTVKETLIL